MKKVIVLSLVGMFVITTSCRTSGRKCNGKRGTRTPMGNMQKNIDYSDSERTTVDFINVDNQ